MDSLFDSVDSQLVVVVAAIAVFILLSRLAFRVLNVGLGPILTIAVILLVLQYFFNISPKELWFEVVHLPRTLVRLFQSLS